MKNITEYFSYLYLLERTGMKYDLSNITRLLKSMGNPHKNIKTIHIAGTNGKGATASFIASILTEHGTKVGLFTSPHILRFNERIRMNGKCISNEYLKDFLTENLPLIKKIKPSFFEVNTAMAFKYFSDKKVDIAIVECGLGGRLDSTNVITPEVSVITQIGIDHTQFLGNTLEKIAKEKLGIVKKGIDVIVSDNNKKLKKLFKQKIIPKHLFYIDDMLDIRTGREKFSVYFKPIKQSYSLPSPLPGDYQPRNAVTAIIACLSYADKMGKILYLPYIKKGIEKVKENTGYKGRLEFIKRKGKTYIFDISHNPDGVSRTMKTLKKTKIDVIVFAMMSDKDYRTSVKKIINHSKNIIFTKPNYPRAAEPEMLFTIASKSTKNKNLFIAKKLRETVKIINSIKGVKTVLFIGSFFLISDAIKALKLQKYFK